MTNHPDTASTSFPAPASRVPAATRHLPGYVAVGTLRSVLDQIPEDRRDPFRKQQRSVACALALACAATVTGRASVRDIAHRTQLPVALVVAALAELRAARLAECDPSGRYRLVSS